MQRFSGLPVNSNLRREIPEFLQILRWCIHVGYIDTRGFSYYVSLSAVANCVPLRYGTFRLHCLLRSRKYPKHDSNNNRHNPQSKA